MAIAGISLGRVSFNQRSFNLLEAMRMNQSGLFREQTRLSTGLRFIKPSEQPVAAASAAILQQRLDDLRQVQDNVAQTNSVLVEVDTAMQESLDLLTEAKSLAVQAVDDGISTEERQALLTVVDSLIDQMIAVGNRKHLNTYLFAGQQDQAPFEQLAAGVYYSGDASRRETIVDTDNSVGNFTYTGLEFFGAVSSEVRGVEDLNPAVTKSTRISELNGALGHGVELGRVRVATAQGQADIDLRGADNLGDIVDRLNAELPIGLQASIGTNGIALNRFDPALGAVTISDLPGGRAAADLGLSGTFDAALRAEVDLDPRLTLRTKLGSLENGAGIDLSGGIVVRNGDRVATIDFAGTDTVEDLINRIHAADVGVWARIADDGRGLELRSRIAGAELTVEENGGLAATRLGLRSLHAGTTLDDLNLGRGIETRTGVDFRLTTADGTQIDVDLSGARTLGDVINAINAAGGAALEARLASTGNGLVLTDQTAGPGTLTLESQNGSHAHIDLGIDGFAVGKQIVGTDVNPIKAESPFTALYELRSGMDQEDRTLMTQAGERIERVMQAMQRVQGAMASQAEMMDLRGERVDTEVTTTQILLSDVQDTDVAETAVRFQQLQMALQANLSTAAQVMNLSVLDYL
jgi:flagellin-like hook-associated protein FlgL